MAEYARAHAYRSLWSVLFIAAIGTVLALLIAFRLELRAEDRAVTSWSDRAEPKDIVLVTITEETLAQLAYRSPVDRAFLAEIVEHIDRAGARAIGIDILIDQPSEPVKDEKLQRVLREAKAAIVLGYATADESLTERQVAFLERSSAGLGRGLVTLRRDNFDGVVRQTFTGRNIDDQWRPGLAAMLAEKSGAAGPFPEGRIAYFSQANGLPFAFPTYPAHTVKLLPAQWFQGKTVLIGSAQPTADSHATPFVTTLGAQAGSLYGVAIHAHMLAQFTQSQRITSLGPMGTVLYVFCAALLSGFLVLLRVRPLVRLGLVLLFMGALAGVFYGAFAQAQMLVPIATPIVAVVLTGLTFAFQEWRRDRQERQFIQSAFAQYVSPAVVRRIADRQSDLKLGGEVRRVTYVFTDLENFTTMCEGLEPERVAFLLNDYLSRMCDLFIEHDATIDKIIGDAVVGFFGAPAEQNDQCQRAVKLALALDAFASNYRQERRREGLDFGMTRIGVHTGDAVVGNFGGKRFMDYTAMGDTVNTAARMESANKHLGTRICVSAAVQRECPDQHFRKIGKIFLKGKNTHIECYEPLAEGQMTDAELKAYEAAYNLMDGSLPAASQSFAELLETMPNDPLVQLHAHRLRQGEAGSSMTLREK